MAVHQRLPKFARRCCKNNRCDRRARSRLPCCTKRKQNRHIIRHWVRPQLVSGLYECNVRCLGSRSPYRVAIAHFRSSLPPCRVEMVFSYRYQPVHQCHRYCTDRVGDRAIVADARTRIANNKAVNRSTQSRGNRNQSLPFVPGYGCRSAAYRDRDEDEPDDPQMPNTISIRVPKDVGQSCADEHRRCSPLRSVLA